MLSASAPSSTSSTSSSSKSRPPPLAVRTAKKTILNSYELSLKSGLIYERAANLSLYHTKDKKEGIASFLEKRKPKWSGE